MNGGEDIRAIEAAAARWFVRLHDHPVSAQTETEFDAWLDQSSQHRACYMRCEVTMALARGLGDEPALEADLAAVKRIAAAEAEQADARRRFGAARRVWIGAIAATLVAAAGVGYFLTGRPVSEHYATAIGEQRSITLADHSIVTLNTDTALDVTLSKDGRRVDMQHGEAFFSVAHDPSRAFDVWAAGGKVRAVGTQFGVAIDRGEVTVSVLEGRVLVQPTGADGGVAPQVAANQSVRYRSGGTVSAVGVANVNRIIGWREGKLVFENVTLAEAFAEYNRYTTRKFVVGPGRIGQWLVTGSLRIGDADALVFMLRESFDLNVVEQGDVIYVEAR